MVSPEALKLNEILRNAPKAVDMDLPHQREADEHAEDMTSEPEGVRFEDTPAVGGHWDTPRSWDGKSVIIYLYGGGYVISSPHSRRKLASHLANAAGTRALVPMIRAWVPPVRLERTEERPKTKRRTSCRHPDRPPKKRALHTPVGQPSTTAVMSTRRREIGV